MAALCLLALLAPASVVASGLPVPLKQTLAWLAGLTGLALARREALRPVLSLTWQGDTLILCDAHGSLGRLHCPVLHEQGPLLRIEARGPGGRRWSRTWWPDTLSDDDRRRLRLAASVSSRSAIHLPSMAA